MLVRSRNSLSSKCKGWVSVSPLRLTLNASRKREQLTVNVGSWLRSCTPATRIEIVSFKQKEQGNASRIDWRAQSVNSRVRECRSFCYVKVALYQGYYGEILGALRPWSVKAPTLLLNWDMPINCLCLGVFWNLERWWSPKDHFTGQWSIIAAGLMVHWVPDEGFILYCILLQLGNYQC